MKKAFIYARVSTGEQAKGYSLEAQLDEIERYCTKNEIKVIEKFTDTLSGTKLVERRGLMNMLDQIEQDSPDYVIATESDRISRNTFQLGWIDTHLSMKGVKLVLVNEKESSGPFGKAFQKIRAVFSEFENDLRQWRINRGREKAMQENRFMNRPPFGYTIKGKTVVSNPDTTVIVKEIFNAFNKGFSIKRLARTYNKSPVSIRYILSNMFYSDSKLYGDHTTFIEAKVFDSAQKRLKRNKNMLLVSSKNQNL